MIDLFSALWARPMASLALFSLVMGMASLWIRKTAWLWGSFLILACACGLNAGLVDTFGLIALVVLFALVLFFPKSSKKTRIVLIALITGISMMLYKNLVLGMNAWVLLDNIKLSDASTPFRFSFYFGKPAAAIMLLALAVPLGLSQELKERLRRALPWTLGGILILLGAMLSIEALSFDPKIPFILPLWLVHNLFFVSLPEEALFRGFLQRELMGYFKDRRWGTPLAVIAASILFTLLHIHWLAYPKMLLLVFVAGCIYGTIYAVSESVEASTFCHFSVNLLHLLLFTYPFAA